MPNIKSDASVIIRSAISAVLPGPGVKKALEEVKMPAGKVIVISVGKAAYTMAKACEEAIGNLIHKGLIVTKYGHARKMLPHFECIEAGHPIPDENSYKACERAIALVQDLSANDLVLFLLSGGASALFEKPLVPEETVTFLTERLLKSGADITELNTVRKHLSAVKGGRFAKLAAPAHVHSIILSDVLGNDISAIGSGPTSPDQSTAEDANAILEKYAIRADADTLAALLQETPKTLTNVTFRMIGDVTILTNAARQAAEDLGYRTVVLTDCLTCEAKEAGAFFASIAKTYSGSKRSFAVLAGGETVVHVKGSGKGGRNQEMALACADGIAGLKDVCFFSVGSDGTDGPTDAAGGIVDGETKTRLASQGIGIHGTLENNDAYNALYAVQGLVVTGATGTNVNDLSVLLIRR